MDKQTGKFIARIAENLPDMECSVMQEWIDDPLRLQKFLGGFNPPAPAIPAEPVVKFGLLAHLGIVEVPANYVHETEFAGMQFPTPSRVLKPGQRYWVRVHKQVVGGTTTSEERLAYLAGLKSYLVGAPGVRLVRGDKKAWAKVPKGYWHASFGEKDRLPIDADGYHRVPAVYTYWVDVNFNLGYFEDVWDDVDAFFSFCDVPSGT